MGNVMVGYTEEYPLIPTLLLHPTLTFLLPEQLYTVADLAEHRKAAQYIYIYTHLQSSYLFAPVSVKTLGSVDSKRGCFLREIAQHIKTTTGKAQ